MPLEEAVVIGTYVECLAAGLEHSRDLVEGLLEVLNVFERVVADHEIERCIREWYVLGTAETDSLRINPVVFKESPGGPYVDLARLKTKGVESHLAPHCYQYSLASAQREYRTPLPASHVLDEEFDITRVLGMVNGLAETSGELGGNI